MKLLPDVLRATLPPLYSQENATDLTVHMKFFTPDSGWTWLVTEGEPDGEGFRFFGYVIGMAEEWGYFVRFLTQMYARFSSRQVGQRRGKTLRMCSCPVRSGAVVCRSIDGRLRGPRSWWGACSAAAGSDASC